MVTHLLGLYAIDPSPEYDRGIPQTPRYELMGKAKEKG
jgi:hypothetical protein